MTADQLQALQASVLRTSSPATTSVAWQAAEMVVRAAAAVVALMVAVAYA